MLGKSREPLNLPEAEAEASVSDVWGAAQDITMTLTESFMQSEARETASKIGKKISADEANKRYPGLNADREISEGEAQYLYDWKQERAEKQKIIESASDSFLKGSALPFVAGAAKSFLDPAEVAIGFATGGIGNGLKVGASAGKKVAVDFFEAGLSQAIAEAPIMKETNESFEEYTTKQFAQNALLASVMQVGIQYGASATFKGTAKALQYVGESTSENLYKLQRTLESQGVNSTGVMNQIIEEVTEEYSNVGTLREVTLRNLPEGMEVKGDNFEDFMSDLISKNKTGEISDDVMDIIAQEALDNGVNPQMLKRAVEDTAYEFSEDTIQRVKRESADPKNQIGFEDRFDAEIDELDSMTIDRVDQEIAESFNASFENLSEDVLEDIVEVDGKQTMKVAEYRDMIKQKKESQKFLEEYAACITGGLGNVPM